MQNVKVDGYRSDYMGDYNRTKRPERRSGSRSLRVAVAAAGVLLLSIKLAPDHWALDGLNPDSTQEEELKKSLLPIYNTGQPVDVECDQHPASKTELEKYSYDEVKGFVDIGGNPNKIHLRGAVCDNITKFDPRSIELNKESLVAATKYIIGAETLIHEAEHTQGELNEARTEYNSICGGLVLRYIESARGGSLDVDLANTIQEILEQLNKAIRPERYRVDC